MKLPAPFGKYHLLEKIATGGMAEVYLAKAYGAAGFERLLVIKKILPHMAEDEEFITMFIDEARIASTLTHSNIVQITELGREGTDYYIAMEYVHGKDLSKLFDRLGKLKRMLPIPLAVLITCKLCEGLDYAHNKTDSTGRSLKIVHRDVSPGNVLLSYEGDVKLIDFGIAKAQNRVGRTTAGTLKGKFGYMSPEQVRGLPVDHRSDIFSVGILLYEMLTGERLFHSETDIGTLERVRNAEITPPTTYNAKIPPELEKTVMKALAREPEERFQSAAELHEAIAPFLLDGSNLTTGKSLGAFLRQVFEKEIAEENARLAVYRRKGYPWMDEAAGEPVDLSHEGPDDRPPEQETKLIAPEDIGSGQEEVVTEEQATVLFKPDEVMPPAQDEPPARASTGTQPRRRLNAAQIHASRRVRTGTEPIRGRPLPAKRHAGRPGPVLLSFLAGLAFAGLAAGLVLFFTGDDRKGGEQPSDYAIVSPVSPSPSATKTTPPSSTAAATKHDNERAKPHAAGNEPSSDGRNDQVAPVSPTTVSRDREKASGEAAGKAGKKGNPVAGKPDKKESSKKSTAERNKAAKAPTMSPPQQSKPALALAKGEARPGGLKVPQKERPIGKGKKAAPRPSEKAASAEKRAGEKAPRSATAARLLSVRVESSPPGAEILLNGKKSGKTPRNFELEPNRNYFIILKKKGYKPYFHGLKPGEPRKVRISAKLQPKASGGKKKFGYLVANTRPWARVLVDGKDSGLWTPIPPAKKLKLPAGRHRVTFRTQDGKELTVTVTIEEGKTTKVIKVIK